jgi:glycine cleavage system T protein (aminomethyltransferase)
MLGARPFKTEKGTRRMAKILKRSPHYGQHLAHAAKEFFDFAGWEMPTHFSSLAQEAHACRNSAILFDGHAMGELHIRGKDALKAVQKLCVNDIAPAQPGMMVYTSLCTPEGGIFDDLVVFCLAPDHYLLTMAAFNTHKTPAWAQKHTAGMDVCVYDMSAGTTCIEIQGPKSRQIMQKIADFDASNERLPYYRLIQGKLAGIDCIVARLGITGELGYEIFYDAGYAWTMYDAFLKAGQEEGLELCGNRTLGTFRLEKVYHIYTRDIDESTNPYEAGLGRTVKLDKGDFIGRAALAKIQEQGPSRKLVGFMVGDKPVTVVGKSPITSGSQTVGHVTIVGFSPTLKKAIGLGYVATQQAAEGTELSLTSDAGPVAAKIVPIPFFDPKGSRIRV